MIYGGVKMTVNVCSDPDFLRIMLFVNTLLTIAKIILPLAIIVVATLDITKLILEGTPDEFKRQSKKFVNRLISAVIIFFIPTIINVIFGFVDETFDFMPCFTNATQENVKKAYERRADLALYDAESSLNKADYDLASMYILLLDDGYIKDSYKARLETLKKTMDDQIKSATKVVAKPKAKKTTSNLSAKLEIAGSYYPTSTATATVGVKLKKEPDPSAAIRYWSKYVDSSNFVYPKDQESGASLGAWPKNYDSMPTQITNYKTYKNTFIFPVTPENGTYHFVYNHNGIDIMAPIGTPVYSPVDGTLNYSTWGHTANTGGDETAYTVSINLDKPIKINNVTVSTAFLTHMSGIRYRCNSNCNRKIKKGELIGFTGNAGGTAETVSYAPHLHMTLHTKANYRNGLNTNATESLYGIPKSASSYKIKAGE